MLDDADHRADGASEDPTDDVADSRPYDRGGENGGRAGVAEGLAYLIAGSRESSDDHEADELDEDDAATTRLAAGLGRV
jgi:hypothetical protein